MADVLLQEKKGEGITLLTLNRPEAMNCFSFELLGASERLFVKPISIPVYAV